MSPAPDYVAELALIELSKMTRPKTAAEWGGEPGDVPEMMVGDMPSDNPRDEHGQLRPKKDLI